MTHHKLLVVARSSSLRLAKNANIILIGAYDFELNHENKILTESALQQN